MSRRWPRNCIAVLSFPLLITAWLFATSLFDHLNPDQGSAVYSWLSSSSPGLLRTKGVAVVDKAEAKAEGGESRGDDTKTTAASLPADSTVECHLQNDGWDKCSYTNVCIDLPTDEWPADKPPQLYLIEKQEHGPLQTLARNINSESWSYDLADVQDPLLFRPRVVPFTINRMDVNVIRPEEATMIPPTTGGGAGGGAGGRRRQSPALVTWSEDAAYMAMNNLYSHLWGWFASVGSPLFAAFFANVSSPRLGLPPMRHVVVLSDGPNQYVHSPAAWNTGTPYPGGGPSRWAREVLAELMAFFASEHRRIFATGGRDGGDILQSALFEPLSASEANSGEIPPRTPRKQKKQAGATNGTEYSYSEYAGTSPQVEPGFVFGVDGYRGKARLAQHGRAIVDACFANSTTIDVEATWLPRATRGLLITGDTTDKGNAALQAVVLCVLEALFQGPQPAISGSGLPFDVSYSDPRPHTMRSVYTARDQNFHPIQVAVMEAVRDKVTGSTAPAAAAASTLLAALKAGLDRLPHRMCYRRAVLVGQRDNMVSGFAEAAYWRRFAVLRLGVSNDAITNKWPPPKVLLFDRLLDPQPETDITHKFTRHYVNREEMEDAVILKYGFQKGVNYTLLTDADIAGMDLKQQAQLFSQHGVIIVAHGATMTTFAFALSAHTAVIEMNPFGMMCPVFHRMLTASGHVVFPFYSKQKSPYMDYSATWPYTDQQALEFHKRCDALGPWESAEDPECWHEFRQTSIQVPIPLFEHVFLEALAAAGMPLLPKDSAIAKLTGVPDDGHSLAPPVVSKDFYKRNAWTLTPPVDPPSLQWPAANATAGGGAAVAAAEDAEN